ncbi:hypothetical protein COBT_003371 [Conglomerata obtusa]
MFDKNTNSFPKYNDGFATPLTKEDKHTITNGDSRFEPSSEVLESFINKLNSLNINDKRSPIIYQFKRCNGYRKGDASISMPNEMFNTSLSKNLLNSIIDMYTEDEIKIMVDAKTIYEKPKYDNRYTHYLSWKKDIFKPYGQR